MLVQRKGDALRSLRTPGTQSPRNLVNCCTRDLQSIRPGGIRHSLVAPSPSKSDARNPQVGWIRFRGPINLSALYARSDKSNSSIGMRISPRQVCHLPSGDVWPLLSAARLPQLIAVS